MKTTTNLQALAVIGATILDGRGGPPIKDGVLVTRGERIEAVGGPDTAIPPGARRLEAQGKFVIPGLMNANVHLMGGCMSPANLLRYEGRYEDLIAESAQVALKNGLTTVFDTLGIRKPLMVVRDRIARGEVVGSRVQVAGWILGLDGFFSLDFSPRVAEILSVSIVERINGMCVENVGPALSWMSAEQVAAELRKYIATGVDFIKYASSEHRWGDPTTSLVFSPRVQKTIVDVTHEAGRTAQAHASSVESIQAAAEAGCDLIQHVNISGPFTIPPATLQLMAERRTGAVLFPFTRRRYDFILNNCEIDRAYFKTSNENCRLLVEAGAMCLLANDGSVWGPEIATDPRRKKFWVAPGEDDLSTLEGGHFVWLKAMAEMGMEPAEMLKAATVNIATAYGMEKDLGTLEKGKYADLLVLDKDPFASAENYRAIHSVVKGGAVVDRERLPEKPILTLPLPEPTEEVLAYRGHRHVGRSGFPMCPLCVMDH